MKKKQGFTLIELVVVIVVLGLLAVAALPRFVDVTDSAQQASVEGVAGGYATAVLSARAQWEGEGRPTSGTQSRPLINYDGQGFWLTEEDGTFRNGYPYALEETYANGDGTPDMNDARCQDLMENLLQNPPTVETGTVDSTSSARFFAEATTTTTCQYTQNSGAGHSFTYDITTGSVTVSLN